MSTSFPNNYQIVGLNGDDEDIQLKLRQIEQAQRALEEMKEEIERAKRERELKMKIAEGEAAQRQLMQLQSNNQSLVPAVPRARIEYETPSTTKIVPVDEGNRTSTPTFNGHAGSGIHPSHYNPQNPPQSTSNPNQYYPNNMQHGMGTQYTPVQQSTMAPQTNQYWAPTVAPQNTQYWSQTVAPQDTQLRPQTVQQNNQSYPSQTVPQTQFYSSQNVPQNTQFYSSQTVPHIIPYYPSQTVPQNTQSYPSQPVPQNTQSYSSQPVPQNTQSSSSQSIPIRIPKPRPSQSRQRTTMNQSSTSQNSGIKSVVGVVASSSSTENTFQTGSNVSTMNINRTYRPAPKPTDKITQPTVSTPIPVQNQSTYMQPQHTQAKYPGSSLFLPPPANSDMHTPPQPAVPTLPAQSNAILSAQKNATLANASTATHANSAANQPVNNTNGFGIIHSQDSQRTQSTVQGTHSQGLPHSSISQKENSTQNGADSSLRSSGEAEPLSGTDISRLDIFKGEVKKWQQGAGPNNYVEVAGTRLVAVTNTEREVIVGLRNSADSRHYKLANDMEIAIELRKLARMVMSQPEATHPTHGHNQMPVPSSASSSATASQHAASAPVEPSNSVPAISKSASVTNLRAQNSRGSLLSPAQANKKTLARDILRALKATPSLDTVASPNQNPAQTLTPSISANAGETPVKGQTVPAVVSGPDKNVVMTSLQGSSNVVSQADTPGSASAVAGKFRLFPSFSGTPSLGTAIQPYQQPSQQFQFTYSQYIKPTQPNIVQSSVPKTSAPLQHGSSPASVFGNSSQIGTPVSTADSSTHGPSQAPLFLPPTTPSPIPSPGSGAKTSSREVVDLSVDEVTVIGSDVQKPEPLSLSAKARGKRKMIAYVEMPPRPAYVIRDQLRQRRNRLVRAEEVGDDTSSRDTPVRDPQEEIVREQSISSLQSVPCKWGGCDAVLNSAAKLAQHLRNHIRDSGNQRGSYPCLWQHCGRQEFNEAPLLLHIESHAYQPLRCPYQKCKDTFRSSRQLLQHTRGVHSNDKLGPSADLFVPRPAASLPEAPASLPSYMIETRSVAPHPISKERHEVLAPWVLKNLMPSVDLVRLKRYKAARQLRNHAVPATFDNELVVPRSSPSCMPSRGVNIRDIKDLNTEQVSQLVIEGLTLWQIEDDADEIDFLGDDINIRADAAIRKTEPGSSD